MGGPDKPRPGGPCRSRWTLQQLSNAIDTGDATPSHLVLGETLEHLPSALRAKIDALHELVRSRIGRIAPLSEMLLSCFNVADYLRAEVGHDHTESFWIPTLDAKTRTAWLPRQGS